MKQRRCILFAATILFLVFWSGLASANFINGTTVPPASGPTPDEACLPMGNQIWGRWSYCDVASGLFSFSQVDMALAGPMPIVLRRIYRSEVVDTHANAVLEPFGNGTSFDYNMFLWSESEAANGTLTNADLILPSGARVFCTCPVGDDCTPTGDKAFQCLATPSQTFYGATIQYIASPQSWVLTTKDQNEYSFDYGQPQGSLLQSITDRNGNQITITRTSTKITLSSSNGRSINLTLSTINGADVITQAQDSAGRTTSYGYTTYGSGSKQTSMTSSTDLNGKTTNYTWYTPEDVGSIKPSQQNGQFIEEADIGYTPSGCGSGCKFGFLTPPQNQGYYQIVYNADGTKDIYDPQVIKRHLVFNSGGYLTSETLNYGSTPSEPTTYVRDPTSNFVTQKTDALGRETKYGYDFSTTKVGDLLSVTRNATGTPFTTTFAYTPTFHVLDSIIDPLGHTTTFTPFSPDTNGNIQTFKDAVGNTITFSYNPAGQVLTATDQASDKTTFGYAGTGDLTSVIDPNNFKTASGYDLAGRLTSVTDPLRNTTSYQLDGVGRVTQVTDPGSGITKFVYDDVGNLLSVTDANNHVTTTNKYDLRNRLTSACDALDNCTTYGAYDADDNLTKVTTGTLKEMDYKYDNLNRRSEIDYDVVSGTPTSKVTLAYDLGDRLTAATDTVAGGNVTRQYGSGLDLANGYDFVTKEVMSTGTVTYGEPDAAGRRTTMTVTGQTPVSYSFDFADKLTGVTQGSWNVTKSFNYSAGRLDSITLPNLVKMSYTYDSDSQVKSVTYKRSDGATLGTLTYNYDGDGRRFAVGGTLATTSIPAAQTFGYNNDDSLSKIGALTVTNDNDGNISSGAAGAFTYDERGHLQQSITTVNGQSLTEQNFYDAVGRRYAKTVTGSGSTTPYSYQYDGLNVVLTQSGSSGFGSLVGLDLDELFMLNYGFAQDSVLRDALGSTVGLTDTTQTVTDLYSYEPYGATMHNFGTNANPYQFSGRENDFNNLYFMRNRYYLPSIARFISRDPTGGQVNPYLYAGDSPTNFTDPLGTDFGWTAVGEIGFAFESLGGIAISGGFVGAYEPQPMQPISLGGLDIRPGRQTNGGNADPEFILAAFTVKVPPGVDPGEAYSELTWGMVGFGMAGEWQNLTRSQGEQKFVRYLARKVGLDTPEGRNILHKLLEQAHTEAENIGPKVRDLITWIKSQL